MTDRDRLINEFKKAKNKCLIYESGGCLACKYRGIADCTLESLADYLLANGVIVPIRCKDCKHFTQNNGGYCEGYNGLTMTNENQFCSYGELKEQEND